MKLTVAAKSPIRKLGLALAVVVGAGVVASVPASATVPLDPEPTSVNPDFQNAENFLQLTDAGNGFATGSFTFSRGKQITDTSPTVPECVGVGTTQVRASITDFFDLFFFEPTAPFDIKLINAAGDRVSVASYDVPNCDTPITINVSSTQAGTWANIDLQLTRGGVAVFSAPNLVVADSVQPAPPVSVLDAPSITLQPLTYDLGVNDAIGGVDVVRNLQYKRFPDGTIDGPGVCPPMNLRVFAQGDFGGETRMVGPINGTTGVNGGLGIQNVPCDTPIVGGPFDQPGYRTTAIAPGVGTLKAQLVEGGVVVAESIESLTITGTPNKSAPVLTQLTINDGDVFTDGAVPTLSGSFGCSDDPISFPYSGAYCFQTGYSTAIGEQTMTQTATSFGGTTTAAVTYNVIPDPASVGNLPALDSVSASNVEQGSSLTASSGGFVPGENVDVYLYSSPVLLDTVVADGAGVATATVTIPAHTAPGAHTLTFIAASGVAQGASITIEEPAPPVVAEISGFYNPIDMDAVNTGKANRAFPLKFNVELDGIQLTDPADVAVSVKKISCENIGDIDTDTIEETFYSELPLMWDGEQFHTNMKIGKEGSGCYKTTAKAVNGTGGVSALFDLS